MKRTDIIEGYFDNLIGTQILLFSYNYWSKEKVSDYLVKSGVTFKPKQLRSGFSHLVFINSNNISIEPTSIEPIIILEIDYEKQMLLPDKAYLIVDNTRKVFDLPYALDNDTTNFLFDVKNFGFIPNTNSDFFITTKNINELLLKLPQNIPDDFDLTEIVLNDKIDNNVKKILLDIVGLIAAHLYNQIIHTNSKDIQAIYVQRYSALITSTFVIRAIIEKLILLIAQLDEDIEYRKIVDSKSMKSSFLKEAVKSNDPITKEFLHYITNVEILDNSFRTPEIHKLGRIFGLLNYDINVYDSLFNEISAHFNYANIYVAKIIKLLRVNIKK